MAFPALKDHRAGEGAYQPGGKRHGSGADHVRPAQQAGARGGKGDAREFPGPCISVGDPTLGVSGGGAQLWQDHHGIQMALLRRVGVQESRERNLGFINKNKLISIIWRSAGDFLLSYNRKTQLLPHRREKKARKRCIFCRLKRYSLIRSSRAKVLMRARWTIWLIPLSKAAFSSPSSFQR